MKTKKTNTASRKSQLYDDRTGNEKACNKSDYQEDYDTKDEVKKSEDNWNNEGGTITSNDKEFEEPEISYDNSKDQKKLFKKAGKTKVKVSKVTKTGDKDTVKKRRA